MYRLILCLLLGMGLQVRAQDTLQLHPDLRLIALGPHTWQHTSNSIIEPWGKVSSNGLIVVDQKEALLFDTPMEDSLTERLLKYLREDWKVQVKAFVPNHWHDDCVAGMDVLQAQGVPVYTLATTNAILRDHQLPQADFTFSERILLRAGNVDVLCRHYGAGHTVDNIVTFVPADRVLFGGCQVKSVHATSLGNTADADLATWPHTIARIQVAHPGIQIVVPGHGGASGQEALDHTLHLLKAH
ncbi:MAG: subclass B1 metallo-beta-lactamase [Bacteroidota bacterium]